VCVLVCVLTLSVCVREFLQYVNALLPLQKFFPVRTADGIISCYKRVLFALLDLLCCRHLSGMAWREYFDRCVVMGRHQKLDCVIR